MWILSVVSSAPSFGQNLLMFKSGKHIAYYKAGDVLSFRIKGDPSKMTDEIRGFQDSLIVFKHNKVDVREITNVYLDKKSRMWYFFKYKYEVLLPMLGGAYLVLDVLNTGEVNKETLIISGSLIGAGLLARVLISKRYKIGGKRMLRILEV
jgi:hypothetical protein